MTVKSYVCVLLKILPKKVRKEKYYKNHSDLEITGLLVTFYIICYSVC